MCHDDSGPAGARRFGRRKRRSYAPVRGRRVMIIRRTSDCSAHTRFTRLRRPPTQDRRGGGCEEAKTALRACRNTEGRRRGLRPELIAFSRSGSRRIEIAPARPRVCTFRKSSAILGSVWVVRCNNKQRTQTP